MEKFIANEIRDIRTLIGNEVEEAIQFCLFDFAEEVGTAVKKAEMDGLPLDADSLIRFMAYRLAWYNVPYGKDLAGEVQENLRKERVK